MRVFDTAALIAVFAAISTSSCKSKQDSETKNAMTGMTEEQKKEYMAKLGRALQEAGVESIGPQGEIALRASSQVKVAEILASAGYGLLLTADEVTPGAGLANDATVNPNDKTLKFKIITAPKPIKDILDLTQLNDPAIKNLKVDSAMATRAHMIMVSFD